MSSGVSPLRQEYLSVTPQPVMPLQRETAGMARTTLR
jgi:hypothetical protein